MKELVTRYVKIKNTNLAIRILPIGEIISLISILEETFSFLIKENAFKIRKKINKNLKRIIKQCTNIKRPKQKHFFVLDLILRANFGFVKIPNKEVSKDNIYSLIDLLAKEYSWTEDYILNNITLEKAQKYTKAINQRKSINFASNVLAAAHAFHDPNGKFIKNLYKSFSSNKRKHFNSKASYIKELKKEKNNEQ